jgi:Leucine-rich repeat (LRR) protein
MPKLLPLRADLLLCNTLFEELDDGINADVLRHVSGKEDLEEVDFLEMQVDAVSGTQQVETIGQFLPNLEQLRLNQSMVCSIRDLGTSYGKLRVLSLRQSHLQDIGGIVAMHVLEELYISFNDIRDLSPLNTHDTLQVLDVEGNLIEDLEDIHNLQTLSTLRELSLNSNPVYKREGFSREWVLQALPQIEVLDDIARGAAESDEFGVLDDDIEATSVDDFDVEPLRDPEDLFHTGLTEEESPGLQELRRRATPGSSREAVPPSNDLVDNEDGYSPAIEELRKGLTKLRDESVQGEKPNESIKEEPSEQELIVENLKRARPPVPNIWSLKAMTARGADKDRPMTGFYPDRRGLRTAWSNASSTTYRPTSSSGISSSTKTSSSAAH